MKQDKVRPPRRENPRGRHAQRSELLRTARWIASGRKPYVRDSNKQKKLAHERRKTEKKAAYAELKRKWGKKRAAARRAAAEKE